MSYNKTTWKDGDVITAEKMNNIEEGVASNNSFISKDIEDVTVYEETVSINNSSDAPYQADGKVIEGFIESNIIYVTFDNVEYELEKQTSSVYDTTMTYYGGTDDNKPYPAYGDDNFTIVSVGNGYYYLYCKKNGEHTVKIIVKQEVINISNDFNYAIEQFGYKPIYYVDITRSGNYPDFVYTFNGNWDDFKKVYDEGTLAYIKMDQMIYEIYSIAYDYNMSGKFLTAYGIKPGIVNNQLVFSTCRFRIKSNNAVDNVSLDTITVTPSE